MMNYIGGPFIGPEPHHHHHGPSPVELAQISGASQYARLNTRLQKHIEDDVRHITDEERYKWNKGIYDLKALKEDINDGTIGGGGLDKDELALYLTTHKYATQDWVEGKGYQTESQVNWLITTWFETKFGTADFGKLAKLSDLEGYVKKGSTLGKINGQYFREGGEITIGGGNGLGWDDIIAGLTYNAYINENTSGAQAIGEIRANGKSLFTLYQTDFGGGGGPIPIATTSVLGGIKAGEAYSNTIANATRYWVQVNSAGVASVVIPNRGGNDDPVAGDVYNWNPFFTLYPSNRSADKPQLPDPTTGTWSYGSYTWTDQAPNGSDDYFVWMCLVEYKNSSPTGNVNGPVCLGADPGADANGMEFVYRRWYTENASDVVGNLHAGITSGGKTPTDEDYVPSDWTDHPTGISEDYPFEYMAYRVSTLVNNKRVWANNFSEPFLWAKWGQDGTDGDGIEFIFSNAVDLTTTQANMKTSLTNALTQVFGNNYTSNDTYQNAIEVANVVVGGKSLDSLGWHDNAPQVALGQCVYVSIRKKRWNSNEEKVLWGPFSDPVIWSGISSNTSIIEGGTLYYLTVTPTQIHVDANGVKDADKIYARLYRSDENGTTEMTPTSAPNEYIMRYQFSNQQTDPTAFMDSAYTPNGYQLALTDASSVTISATNTDGIQLCQAVTISQVVDGSVVYGANAIDVNVLNDTLSIGCDSENYIMRNISNEEVYVHAFIGGSPIINACTIKYNNTSLRSGVTSTVTAKSSTNSSNGFSVSVTPYYNNNDITLKLSTSLSISSYQLDKSYYIPLQLQYTEDGQIYTRPFDIKINRINSGAPGVAPTLIKLLVHRDSIYYRENDFYDSRAITGNIEYTNSKGEWKVYNSSTPRPAGLPLLVIRTVGIDGSSNPQSASQFNWSGDTWTFTGASNPRQLFNLYGPQFLIQVVDQTDSSIIYDQEEVDFIKEGKDGTNGTNGTQGMQGCVMRESLIDDGSSDQNNPTIYRNDSNWATNSQIRYIDVVGVPSSGDNANEDGYEWFIVKPTNATSSDEGSGSRQVPYDVAESELRTYVTSSHHSPLTNFEVLDNVSGIYASFILAKNAKIKFLTDNELTIVDSNNNPVAGITGGGNNARNLGSRNVRIWAGTNSEDSLGRLNLSNAAFRVYDDGSLVATSATIYGAIIANEGRFTGELEVPNGGLKISSNGRGSIAGGRIWWDENGVYIQDYTLIGGDNTGDNGSTPSGSSSSQQVQVTSESYRDNGSTVTADITIKNQTGKRVYGYVDVWVCSSTYKMSTSNIMVPVWRAEESKPFDIPANETSKPFTYTIPKTSPLFDDFTPGIDTDKSFAWVPRYTEGVTDNSVKRWSNIGVWDD